MKINVQLGDDFKFVREELETMFERAMSEQAGAARPEFSAGFMAATSYIIDSIEGRYEALRQEQGPRKVRDA